MMLRKNWSCRLLLLIGWSILFVGCDSTEDVESNLADFVASSTLPMSDQLIACAGGGEPDDIATPDAPISVYYYPIAGAKDFKYFETTDIGVDPNDLQNYEAVNLEDQPFFNGYLRRFKNIPLTQERWARITYETNDSLHVSNAIRLKYPVLPTTYDSLKVDIAVNGTNPTFSWPNHDNPLDVIYFQVVSDRNGNLISGTYTFEKQFTFYDLENVVLNIRDVTPAPVLAPNESYRFTLMTVSSDNWVNLVAERQFSTQ